MNCSRWLIRSVTGAVIWLIAIAATAPGQGARGTVVDSASRQPIAGAVVVLLDAKRQTLARMITGARGTFDIGAPGATMLRVVRLGFRPREIDLTAKTNAVPVDVVMSALSMLLEPVQVSDSSGCPRRPGNLAAVALWDQAKAALLAAVIARQTLPSTMTNLTYKRTMEGNSDRFNEQEVRIHRGNARSSFGAVQSVAEFLRYGFVRTTVDGDLYFGPDADILLDERFMRNYCLSMAPADKSRANEAGVPAQRRRDRVDINGTIWIDTAHRTLRSIAFRYIGLDPATDRFRSGGELSFLDVRPGVPQIQRWTLRTVADKNSAINAAVGRTAPSTGPGRYEVHEEGGELARADWSDGISWKARLGIARIHAKTKDGGPAVGVTLSLDGSDYVATTDSTGTAEITDLLPGPYRVSVIDSALAIVGATGSTGARFVAARDSIIDLSLVVPSAAEHVEAACRRENVWTPGSYSLVVRVVNPDGTPVAGARWSVSVGRTTGVTGLNGVFQYCFGLDLGTIVQIRVSRDGEVPTTVTRTLSRKLTAVRFELPRK